MKFVEPRPYADPDAARKLVEIASTIEPVQAGRIYVELVNAPFLFEHPEHQGSPSPRAGCGGTEAAPTCSSPGPARRCSPEG